MGDEKDKNDISVQDDEVKAKNSEEQPHKDSDNKVHRYEKLRKMLSTAALSAALISWYTTANGLHEYAFGKLWQAYVFSAALQGSLFALSILGFEVLAGFNKKGRKLIFIFIWLFLVSASSIFSYAYLSKDVYSDKLLMEDAHRILGTDCLSENYKLDDAADQLLNGSGKEDGILKAMDNYVDYLAILENGVDLSGGREKSDIETLKEDLLSYAYTYSGSGGAASKVDGCVDASKIVERLDEVLSGKYVNQDITDIKAESENMAKSIRREMKRKMQEKQDKLKERDDYQDRLKDFKETSSDAYKKLMVLLENVVGQISDLESQNNTLGTELACIERVPNVLDSVEAGMASTLYTQVIELRDAMNAEKINIEDVQSDAQEIYRTLLDNSANLSANDERIMEYPNFKSDLKKYSAIIEAQEFIENEIENLYNIKSIEKISSDALMEEDGEDMRKEEEKIKAKWADYWQERLNALKENAKKLQAGGLDEAIISDLIEKIEEKERLYLSDLNDFERAYSLLFGRNPEHPYKVMLGFSFLISFGIDLFAVLMSGLLYLFKQKSFRALGDKLDNR